MHFHLQTEYEKTGDVEMYFAGCLPEDLTCPAEANQCMHGDDDEEDEEDISCSGCCDDALNCNMAQLEKFTNGGAASTTASFFLVLAVVLLAH